GRRIAHDMHEARQIRYRIECRRAFKGDALHLNPAVQSSNGIGSRHVTDQVEERLSCPRNDSAKRGIADLNNEFSLFGIFLHLDSRAPSSSYYRTGTDHDIAPV